MYLQTTRFLQLLCMVSFAAGASGCNDTGPGNCQFVDGDGDFIFCGWTLGGNFELTNRTQGGYIRLVRGSDTGSLTSQTACSTGGQTHCFRFAYGVDGDNIFNLSVSIKYGLNESLLWVLSSGGGWKEASVPITTNQDFNVIFRAKRYCGKTANQGSVRIDAIRYNKLTTNSCSFQPPAASPASLPAMPNSCNSIIPLSSPTLKTTIPHDIVTITTNTLSPPSDNNEIEPEESPKEVGIIIGVVIGAIVAILIVVFLLILFRRKRRHSLEAYSAQPNPDSRHSNETPSTQQSDNCNIIRNPEVPTTSTESVMPIYAVVNKLRKTRQENPPLNPHEICDQSSEQHSQNAESESADEQGQDRNGITSTPRKPDHIMAGSESVYQVPRGDPTVNSEDQGKEYNALDFEGNRRVADLDHAEGKHGGGAGDFYSHLNDGEDGTYSEVDRQKGLEVVGDEYFHIW